MDVANLFSYVNDPVKVDHFCTIYRGIFRDRELYLDALKNTWNLELLLSSLPPLMSFVKGHISWSHLPITDKFDTLQNVNFNSPKKFDTWLSPEIWPEIQTYCARGRDSSLLNCILQNWALNSHG